MICDRYEINRRENERLYGDHTCRRIEAALKAI